MPEKLRKNSLLTVLVILVLYAGVFVLPKFFIDVDPEQHGVAGVKGIISEWDTQLFLSIAFIIILTWLGWWKNIGFRRINPGGLKFLLPPVLLALSYLVYAATNAQTDYWFLGFDNLKQMISMILVLLALGFTEETMFRGILFHSLETRYTALLTVVVSAVIFGLFHYVNLLNNAGFYDTTYQVLHAVAAGFMYASLRLRLGAIWPLMIFHGFWDFSLLLSGTLSGTDTGADATSSFSLLGATALMLPAFLYGLFVYWRWSVWHKKQPYNKASIGG